MNLPSNTLIYGFDRLHQNNTLLPDLPLVSRNQAYYFFLTDSGILKIYVSSHCTSSNCIWSSEKLEEKGEGGREKGRIKDDEKRHKKEEARGKDDEIWRMEEEDKKDDEEEKEMGYVCKLDGDGILKVCNGKEGVVWKSREYKRGEGPFQVIIQDDGNLTIYDGEGEEVWVTGNEERDAVYRI